MQAASFAALGAIAYVNGRAHFAPPVRIQYRRRRAARK